MRWHGAALSSGDRADASSRPLRGYLDWARPLCSTCGWGEARAGAFRVEGLWLRLLVSGWTWITPCMCSPRWPSAGRPRSLPCQRRLRTYDARVPTDGNGDGKPALSGEDDGELFLIDGNSLAYRAFFALPESMATSDGRPTNAVYGLASMMVKIVTDHHPAGVVVAWDAGMSGREQTYDLYKAQRKPRPDLLREVLHLVT